MKLLASQHIDKRKWDQMVASDAHLDFFSLSWVWDVLHPDWEMLCDDEGTYLGIIPKGSKLGISYRLQPFFIRSLNIKQNVSVSMSEIQSFISDSASYVHLNFTVDTEAPLTSVGQFQMLNLSPELIDLRNAYSTNAKRILKKIPSGFAVEKMDSPMEFVSFFKQQKGEELNGFTNKVWTRLLKLLEETQTRELLSIYCVKEKNEVIAAGAFISFKDTTYFLKGTATPEAKKLGAMYFLMDEVISKIANEYHYLDFVGSNKEAIAQFYRKFGAVDKSYQILKRNKLPAILRLLKS